MIRRRHSSSTTSTTVSASRSLASVSRSRVKLVPTAAARPATSLAAAVACSRRLRSTAVRSPSRGETRRSTVLRTASMTYSGKPPVVAYSSSASASVSGFQRAEGKLGEQSGGPHPYGPVREFRIFAQGVIAQRRGDQDLGAWGQPEAER